MILFNQIIFGPIKSRRLGVSLGVNLLPIDAKICSFNCIYCECGFNTTMQKFPMPTRQQVYDCLHLKLEEMLANNEKPDVITFAGNGEPTIHPDFESIIDDTISLRNKYFPETKVSVLSNATRIDKPNVISALRKVDNNILKFDSAINQTMLLMDQPQNKHITVDWLIEHLSKFEGQLIIQTMFLRGEVNGQKIDNTSPEEISAWLEALHKIKPKQVMIYSLDREAPVQNLQKISSIELHHIAHLVNKEGFKVSAAD